MKYAAFLLILSAVSATIGCSGSSSVPSNELTPETEAQIEANEKAVHEAESAMDSSKKQ